MTTISAALIVKNESRSIIRALESLVNAVDEIVVVDTGSDDNTVELIEQYALVNPIVKLFNFEWCNDFSAARNFSLEQVTSKWVFVVDGDEYLHKDDIRKLKRLVKHYSNADVLYGLDVEIHNLKDGQISNVSKLGHLRIFPKVTGLIYSGSIHETIRYHLKRAEVSIKLLHDGYDGEQVDQLEKAKRNATLLNEVLQKDPYDSMNLMYFAIEISKFNLQKGLEYFAKARLSASEEVIQWINGHEARAIESWEEELAK